MILRKFNRLDFYDIGEEQRELIKDSLTYDNPKYLQAKRFSGYKNIKIPPYLTYYEEYTDNLGQRVLSVPIGYNYKEILGEDIRNLKITDSREEHRVIYPDFLFDLRHDQKVAEESYFDEINNNSEFPRCLIQLSTGKGKTVLALHIAFRLSVKTLVLVHKDDLVVGWKKDIEKFFGGKIDTGLIKAKSRKVGEQITIATVQTLSRMSEEELSQYTSQFGLVVMDECHRVGINIFNVIDKFGSKYKLGLSATPIRSDGLDFVFKLFFGGIGYKHIIEEGDEDICNCEVRKIKSNYVYKPFVVGNQIFNEEDFKGKMPREFTYLEDIPYKKRPRLMYSTVDNLSVTSNKTKVVVCKKIIEHFREGHSIIAFFNQKEHINIYYRYLSRYIPAEKIALYYGDSKESSQSLMEKAESKEVLITLATYAKATEGTNVKSWEVAFLVSSLNNRKNLEQATGRIRRKKEGKLNPAIVYDVVYDKCYSLQSHYHTREGVYDRLKYIIKDKHKKGLFQRGYQGRS